jgi:hypothetical protein
MADLPQLRERAAAACELWHLGRRGILGHRRRRRAFDVDVLILRGQQRREALGLGQLRRVVPIEREVRFLEGDLPHIGNARW